MSDDFFSSSVKNIFKNGINLNLESIEEEQYYTMKLLEYFEEETEFPTYLRKGHLIEVENLDMQIAVEMMISNSTLYIVPYVNDIFEIFTEVLKFIAHNHEKVMTDFRGVEVSKIENLKNINRAHDETTEEKTEDPNSDDDFEWI
jgi:hypothetical protein